MEVVFFWVFDGEDWTDLKLLGRGWFLFLFDGIYFADYERCSIRTRLFDMPFH